MVRKIFKLLSFLISSPTASPFHLLWISATSNFSPFPKYRALSWPSHTFAQAVLSSGNVFYHLESFYPSITALLKSPLSYNNLSSYPRQSWHTHSEFPQCDSSTVLSQHLLYYNWLIYVCNYKSIKDRDGDYILPFCVPILDTYSTNKKYWISCSTPASSTWSLYLIPF